MHRRLIRMRGLGPFYIPKMPSGCSSCISCRFQPLSTTYGQIAHVLLTRSPLGHLEQALLDLVRLACIRHAASVHPEPGSNSPFDFSSRCHLTSIVSSFQNWRFVLGFFYSVRFSKISFLHRFACLTILPQLGGLCKLFFQALFYQLRSPLAPVYISKSQTLNQPHFLM